MAFCNPLFIPLQLHPRIDSRSRHVLSAQPTTLGRLQRLASYSKNQVWIPTKPPQHLYFVTLYFVQLIFVFYSSHEQTRLNNEIKKACRVSLCLYILSRFVQREHSRAQYVQVQYLFQYFTLPIRLQLHTLMTPVLVHLRSILFLGET